MNITLDSQYSASNVTGNDNPIYTTAYRTAESTKVWGSGYALDITDKVMDDKAYQGQGMTVEDIMQQAQDTNVHAQKDFMIVMSNSVSGEDLEKLKEDGFEPGSTDVETYVSMVDKIKVTLAKAGVEIAGYTDDIDVATIEEIAGKSINANELMAKLQKADIPVTKENMEGLSKAVDEALSLNGLTEDMLKYMILNQKAPTIENLYKAQFSSANTLMQGKGYYSDMVGSGAGYYAKKADTIHWDSIRSQIDGVIKQSGLENNEETTDCAKWLVESGIEMNSKNLNLLSQLKSLSFPMQEEETIDTVITAMGNGKSAEKALLTGEISIAKQACQYVEEVAEISDEAIHEVIEAGQTMNLKNLTAAQKALEGNEQKLTTVSGENVSLREIEARRQLEEIRLMMTEEANRKLMRSGFFIDTTELSKLVDALKETESSMKAALFQGEDVVENDSRAVIYEETVSITKSLPSMPAAVLGKIVVSEEPFTLRHLQQEGTALQKQYQEAEKTYEALMTAPRKDLGDNIQKAFRNVDDILEDMKLEVNDSNRRAVRILGYNNMEITKENIEAVKEADSQVNGIMRRMTPATTLQMIREQKNPLEMSMEELDYYLNDQDKDLGKDTEKFSKFLQKLDRTGSISEEERDAYIGIYRMFRQIEKTDGAVIGSLVASGAEMNFKNLLSAVRTGKDKNMDIRIDAEYGSLEQLLHKNTTIDTQIMAGFSEDKQDMDSASQEEKEKYYARLSGEIKEELAEHTNMDKLQDTKLNETTTIEQFAQVLKDVQEEVGETKVQRLHSFQESMQSVQEVEEAVIQSLIDYEQPVSVDNIQAASMLIMQRGELYKQIFGRSGAASTKNDTSVKDAFESVGNAGQEPESAVDTLALAADKAIEGLTDERKAKQSYQELVAEASKAVEEMIYGQGTSRIDIKAAKALCKGLSLAGKFAQEENYELPVNIKGELTSVNLKIYHNQSKTGKVAITFDTDSLGKVAAEFDVTENKISGMVAFENKTNQQDMEQIKASLEEEFTKAQQETGTKKQVFFSLVQTKNLDLNRFGQDRELPEDEERLSTKELYQTAKAFLTALKSLE